MFGDFSLLLHFPTIIRVHYGEWHFCYLIRDVGVWERFKKVRERAFNRNNQQGDGLTAFRFHSKYLRVANFVDFFSFSRSEGSTLMPNFQIETDIFFFYQQELFQCLAFQFGIKDDYFLISIPVIVVQFFVPYFFVASFDVLPRKNASLLDNSLCRVRQKVHCSRFLEVF